MNRESGHFELSGSIDTQLDQLQDWLKAADGEAPVNARPLYQRITQEATRIVSMASHGTPTMEAAEEIVTIAVDRLQPYQV